MSYTTPSGQIVPSGRRPAAHLWFLLLPIFSVGLGSFVLPLWALHRQSVRRPQDIQDRDVRREPVGEGTGLSPSTLMRLAAGLLLATLATFIFFALAPTDATGAATGPLPAIATVIALVLLAVGVVCALRWRDRLFPVEVSAQIALLNAARVPEPVAMARARRDLREQYRRLATADPVLARELGVGRPASEGKVDDGGLLDVNSLSAEELGREARMPIGLAEQIVELRERHHRLSSVDELVVFVGLPTQVEQNLREYGVFL